MLIIIGILANTQMDGTTKHGCRKPPVEEGRDAGGVDGC